MYVRSHYVYAFSYEIADNVLYASSGALTLQTLKSYGGE